MDNYLKYYLDYLKRKIEVIIRSNWKIKFGFLIFVKKELVLVRVETPKSMYLRNSHVFKKHSRICKITIYLIKNRWVKKLLKKERRSKGINGKVRIKYRKMKENKISEKDWERIKEAKAKREALEQQRK